jgi:hypothetical protein
MAFPTIWTFVLSSTGRRRTRGVLQIPVEETVEAVAVWMMGAEEERINRRPRGNRLKR